MKKEIVIQAKTTEEAIALGAEQLGCPVENVTAEVLEEAKKGFFGVGSAPAKVKVCYILKPLEAARSFVETIISDLGLSAQVVIHDDGDGEALLTVTGDDAGELIGRHGDTLDAFQYLVNLAANKKESGDRKFTRISVDIENYREKREQSLRQLAARVAAKVKKSARSVSLEPMNAYERRIIHSEIQNIEGVSTNSIGAEGNRRVVVFPENGAKPSEKTAPRRKPEGGERRFKNPPVREKAEDAPETAAEPVRQREPREQRERRPERAPYRRSSDAPRPAPRKLEKAKDLDSYFAKLKEFSAANSVGEDTEVK